MSILRLWFGMTELPLTQRRVENPARLSPCSQLVAQRLPPCIASVIGPGTCPTAAVNPSPTGSGIPPALYNLWDFLNLLSAWGQMMGHLQPGSKKETWVEVS